MIVPLRRLDASRLSKHSSLGENFDDIISNSPIDGLIDCLYSQTTSAIHSLEAIRPPLSHADLHFFISTFFLPPRNHRFGVNDRIILLVPPGPEYAVALLALCTNHCCVPVNPSCTKDELNEDASRLGAKAILTTKELAAHLELQSLQVEIILIEPRITGPVGLFDFSRPGANDGHTTNTVLDLKRNGLNDVSLILHTSGTNGKKKVVRYTLRSLMVSAWCVVHSWGLTPSDVNLNMMPLFHVGGIVRNLLAPVLSGGSTIVCTGFDPDAFWAYAFERKPTWYYAAPTIHLAILRAKPDVLGIPPEQIQIRLICNAAAGLPSSIATELRNTFGAVVLPSYGMTECMPTATPTIDYNLDRPGCSGLACGPHLSICDPLDLENQLDVGATGAVCVRGIPTFEGYEISPDLHVPLDRSAFSSEGWFDSGDIGYVDADGYLYITGRSKEIINKGGEVISPLQVEEAIVAAAKGLVQDALAFSVEHDVLQEAIGVVVVPHQGRPRVGLRHLHDLLKGHLHPSRWPFVIVYMDDIPKNSVGKPLRRGLANRLGLGEFRESDLALHRHFEAIVPSTSAPMEELIPCSRVTISKDLIYKTLQNLPFVRDVVLRNNLDGTVAGFISLPPTATSIPVIDEPEYISLPDYSLPNPIYFIPGPLPKDSTGEYDFQRMENESLNAETMTEHQLLVRKIVAEVLDIDPATMTAYSDFFLMGGTSLLVGQLCHRLRRQTGINVDIADLFTESTICGIASRIEEKEKTRIKLTDVGIGTNEASTAALLSSHDVEYQKARRSRSQNHPLCLIVQAIPFLFFYPSKRALVWSTLILTLSHLARFYRGDFYMRIFCLMAAILLARLVVSVLPPVVAVILKWIIIGHYRAGTYKMWSSYHLRWWIVDQILRISGLGIFAANRWSMKIYYRLLGAKIGRDVLIDERMELYECDLLTLKDGCRLDTHTLRGFCVERDGYFRLAPVVIGRGAVINAFTSITPGANIADGAVYGPHASSYESPSENSYAAYNATLIPDPSLPLRIFVAWPIILIVIFISYIPWIFMIYVMSGHLPQSERRTLSDLEAIIRWFVSPNRLMYYIFSAIIRALIVPFIRLGLGVIVKQLLGLNVESKSWNPSQMTLLRRYINSMTLSEEILNDAFQILGSHYEAVSVAYRAMGAKVGQGVYWPRSGIICPDPELLDIGDNVIFGSRSSLITTDKLGSGKIVIEDGAMVADRVILLPGTRVGSKAVMGSGSLGKRNGNYAAGSIWMGNKNGEAVCFGKGYQEGLESDADTSTPFARAFYAKKANYYVFPYTMVLAISTFVTALSAAYWSTCNISVSQILQHSHILHLHVFQSHWYQLGALYGVVTLCFIFIHSFQRILSIILIVATSWLVIGRRQPGQYDWDQSNYCQMWNLHLTFWQIMEGGTREPGVPAALAGTAYIVWYLRAMGATIGKNCAIWAGGQMGVLTEPDLVEIGDEVSLDYCSVVAHLNTRGNFILNRLKIGNGCVMRAESRLLSGASMEDNSMLCEHTLVMSGDVADSNTVYYRWPAERLEAL